MPILCEHIFNSARRCRILELAAVPVVILVWWAMHLWKASLGLNDERPVAYQIGREIMVVLALCFPLVVLLHHVVGQRAALSVGECFGIALSTYGWLAWGASWAFPDGGVVPLVLFVCFGWLLVGMTVVSVALLFGQLFGIRRNVHYRFGDCLGISLVLAFGIMAFVELRLYPPAW